MLALLKRFEDSTLPLWTKHGIRQGGFFTNEIGGSNQTLTYLLQWESLAEREQRWTAFLADPDWQQKKAASEMDGPIVGHIDNSILTPTRFSAMK